MKDSKYNINRQSIYLTAELAAEIRHEAMRLDRPISWLLTQAWLLSREKLKRLRSVDEIRSAKNKPDAQPSL